MCLTLWRKLSLFFLRLPFLEIELFGLEGAEDEGDPGKYDFLGVVGGEANFGGVAGVAGMMGDLSFTGVAGGWLAGSSVLTTPLVVPLGCLAFSGSGSLLSSSFFSTGRVLEEDVPVEAFLGLLIGRA